MRFSNLSIILSLGLLAAVPAAAQVESGGAPVSAGVGKVFEASGRSAAGRELQKKMNSTLIRAIAREKASTRAPRDKAKQSQNPAPLPSSPFNDRSVFFKPDPAADNMAVIANQLGTTAAERESLRQLFAATKVAFEREVAAKGRSSNLPAAFTFFIASTVTVYRDDPEPSDEAIDNLWEGMNSALSELPELSKLSNGEKALMYDTLIALSGFVLAGHMEATASGNIENKAIFKTLSGALIESVLKTDPNNLRFGPRGLEIVS